MSCTRRSAGMYGYLADQAENKRQAPTDDLLSYLVHAEVDGDRCRPTS